MSHDRAVAPPPAFGRLPRLLLVAVAVACLAADSSSPARRARPPAAEWDRTTAGSFFDDAF